VPAPSLPAGVHVTATVSATIIPSARVRLGDHGDGRIVLDGREAAIRHERRTRGRRVLVEFD
jgi:hypothetical protein